MGSGKKLTIGIFVASKSPVIIITANDEEFGVWLEKLQIACNTKAQHALQGKDATDSIVATMVRIYNDNKFANRKQCLMPVLLPMKSVTFVGLTRPQNPSLAIPNKKLLEKM